MKPYRIGFYAYAESDEEVKRLEKTLHDLVDDKYRKGLLVTASRIDDALRTFGNSVIVNNYFNGR